MSLPTTPSFQPRSLSRSTCALPKLMPCEAKLLGLVDHLGGVQQRLRRNAADVQADAAERRPSARRARPSCRGRRRGRRRCSRRGRRRARAPRRGDRRPQARRLAPVRLGRPAQRPRPSGRCCSGGRAAGQRQDDRALAHLVAELHLHLADDAVGGRGHVERRLVALQRDERLVGLDRLARLHVHLDDGHVLEVADVGDLDFVLMASTSRVGLGAAGSETSRRTSSSSVARWREKRAAEAPSMTRWS